MRCSGLVSEGSVQRWAPFSGNRLKTALPNGWVLPAPGAQPSASLLAVNRAKLLSSAG